MTIKQNKFQTIKRRIIEWFKIVGQTQIRSPEANALGLFIVALAKINHHLRWWNEKL